MTDLDREGRSALHYAYDGDPATIRALTDAGADALRVNAHGQSPAGLARLIATSNVAKLFEDVAS